VIERICDMDKDYYRELVPYLGIRPESNRNVISTLLDKYEFVRLNYHEDGRKSVAGSLVSEIFGIHWSGGFRDDEEEILKILKEMVHFIENYLRIRDAEERQELNRSLKAVSKLLYKLNEGK
jgi:hypothetical protein